MIRKILDTWSKEIGPNIQNKLTTLDWIEGQGGGGGSDPIMASCNNSRRVPHFVVIELAFSMPVCKSTKTQNFRIEVGVNSKHEKQPLKTYLS